MEEKRPQSKCNNHIVLNEKVDRLENHFKIYKSDMQDVKGIVKNIESAMIGTSFNGNKGFVHLLDDVNKRLENMEDRQLLYEEMFNGYKWSSRAFVGAVISVIIWFFTKGK